LVASYGHHVLAEVLLRRTIMLLWVGNTCPFWWTGLDSFQMTLFFCNTYVVGVVLMDLRSEEQSLMFWSAFPIMTVCGAISRAEVVFLAGVAGTSYIMCSFWFYRNSVAKSNCIVRPDVRAYLAAWHAVLTDASMLHDLSHLASLVSHIQSSIHTPQAEGGGGGGGGGNSLGFHIRGG